MKTKLLSLLLACGVTSMVHAQLVNDGATIVIEAGATLIVETDIDNNTGSTLTNNGTLIVKGDMTNDASFTNSSTSILRFEGAGDSNFKSSGATVYDLQIAKTSGNVVLVNDAEVENDVEWVTDGRIQLGNNNLTVQEMATFTGEGSNRYVDASGTGHLRREMSSDIDYTLPVGDAAIYSPLQINTQGGAYSAAYLGARVVDAAHPSLPADASDHITRYWNVETSGITAGPVYDLTGTYDATGDIVGVVGDINGFSWTLAGGLDYTNASGNAGNNTVSARVTGENDFDFSGSNRYGSVDVTAFLQGPLNAGGTAMSTAINGILPTTSPYDATVTVPSIPATDIVDWVNVEVRDAANSATVLSSNSAFLKSDGSVVALSGTGPVLIKNAPAMAFVALRHRNHLGVMGASAINLDGSPLDFTDSSTSTFGTNAQVTIGSNTAMKAGDVNADGFLYYLGVGNDRDAILNALSQNVIGFSSGYNDADVNLDSFTYYLGVGNDRDLLLNYLSQNVLGFIQQQLP